MLAALSDPLRLRIVRKLLLESEDFDHTCGWFGLDRPKSSLTHHFRALREAGITRQRQYGLERRSHVRVADLNSRFPGLLDLVADWTPPTDWNRGPPAPGHEPRPCPRPFWSWPRRSALQKRVSGNQSQLAPARVYRHPP